jgi:hypothetical protein
MIASKFKTTCFFLFCLWAGIAFFFSSCEKEIRIDLPDAEAGIVVEGRIESGQPPYVILTKSTGYFESTDINTFLNSFVHNAKITITAGGSSYTLPELCLNDLPPEYRPMAAAFLGVAEEELSGINYCLYTVPVTDLFTGNFLKGETGKTYRLTIEAEGKTFTSDTKIPELVPLDSVWFRLDGADTLYGFAWAHLTDPDSSGNAYRWSAMRINLGSDGKPKDGGFVYPFGSAFDDKFINGKSFEFGYDRGHRPAEEGMPEKEGEKAHFFKLGDTIVVKFCTIEKPVMEFIRKYETEIWNNGNPFASPSSIPTNIEGGAFGLWAGYGVSYDTIYAVQ